MVNRRSVLKLGAATAAGVLVSVPVFGHEPPAAPGLPLQRALFDERFAESRAFAVELQSTGVLTSEISRDVAPLWYGELRPHLSGNKALLAGMTDRAALFCLEELARDVNMRVVFRVDHVIDDREGAEHRAFGPPSLVAAIRGLPREPGFGGDMARLLQQFDSRAPRHTAAQKRTGPFSPHNKTALVSWVIA